TPVDSGTVGTGVTTTTVNGLSAETSYDFYVRTDCAPDGMSNWEGPLAITTTTVSINDQWLEGFVFYPNPMADVLNITGQSKIEKVVLYSITGQKLMEKKVDAPNTNLNVSDLVPSSYFMRVTAIDGDSEIYYLIKK